MGVWWGLGGGSVVVLENEQEQCQQHQPKSGHGMGVWWLFGGGWSQIWAWHGGGLVVVFNIELHVDFERSKAFENFHTNRHGHAQLQWHAAGSFPLGKSIPACSACKNNDGTPSMSMAWVWILVVPKGYCLPSNIL